MIINNKLEEPYDKLPPAESIPFLSRALVKSNLTKKFWEITQNIFETTLKEEADIKKKNGPMYNNEHNNKEKIYYIRNKNANIIKNQNIREKNDNLEENEKEKKKYMEKCKLLIIKNKTYDKIILQQYEENKNLIKKLKELENCLNKNGVNINDNILNNF